MSRETWEKEFYPVSADNAGRWTWLRAAEHSLQKWRGALPGSLKRHGLDAPPEMFTSKTCALCERSRLPIDEYQWASVRCGLCPLAIVRADEGSDYVSCDHKRDDEEQSPFHIYVLPEYSAGDPRPMIKWLEKAVAYLKAKQSKKQKPKRRGKG